MGEITGYDRVKFLAYEHPEWVDVLKAFLSVRKKVNSETLAGSWVYGELEDNNPHFLPNNLKLLVRAGILQKVGDSTRGGHRAYYSLVDPQGVERALKELDKSK